MTDEEVLDEEVLVFPRHAQAAGYCILPGAKDWIQYHGLNWKTFVREGLPVKAFAGIDDALCTNVIAQAIKEHKNG